MLVYGRVHGTEILWFSQHFFLPFKAPELGIPKKNAAPWDGGSGEGMV